VTTKLIISINYQFDSLHTLKGANRSQKYA